ncbi:MAG: hypothetical protein JNM62_15815 [Flavobacteriales bacterium]|nr:hypothetical protein [Flavobacteriales bacterium]
MRVVLYISLIAAFSVSCGGSEQKKDSSWRAVLFPDSISASAFSPDSTIEARIYYWRDENANFLAAERWCLGFSKGETTWFIDRELGEGRGSYESGVYYPEWIDNHQVRIHRRIDDQDADITYDLTKQSFVLER